jgi:2-methylaconitate cis-trans-isomerase PrpF
MDNLESIPFTLMRGGTSKGVFLREEDVPRDRDELTTMILDLMGSPDKRQIDGLGGSDKLTSKVAIIGKPVRADSDLTYLFGQVGVTAAEVDYRPNCGNLSSAVAMYAIQERLVDAVEGNTRVRIHNLNTDKMIFADVRVKDGVPLVKGDLAIGGVPGTGSPIGLDFSRSAGATTGKLLPFGEPLSMLDVPGHGSFEVSVIDCANLVIFVAASSLGMQGTEAPLDIDGNEQLVARINAIRQAVAYRLGLREYWDSRKAPATPFLVVVRESTSYPTFTTGSVVEANSIDLVCRSFATGTTHQAMPVTVTSCTGAACRVADSIPNRLLSARARERDLIEIGHPSGVIGVEARVEESASGPNVTLARIFRTARRMAEGRAFLKGQY